MKGQASEYESFLVSKDSLSELLKSCPICGAICLVTTTVDGASISVVIYLQISILKQLITAINEKIKATRSCPNRHEIPIWRSSQIAHTWKNGAKEKLKGINLDITSSTLVTGSSFMVRYQSYLLLPCTCLHTT